MKTYTPIVICDCCKRSWHSCAVRKCPTPKAKIKGITHICRECCKKCKHSKQSGTGWVCEYKEETIEPTKN